MRSLDQLWQTIAGPLPPIAHGLKFDLKQRWVRFHSLPNSKRYPDNESEILSIVGRHTEILLDVFRPNELLFVVELTWSEETSSEVLARGYTHWRDVVIDQEGSEGVNYAFVKIAAWSSGSLNWAIRKSANDKLHGFMAIGSESQAIYHPYDGGLDVIMPTSIERDDLKQKHQYYLSTRPDGL